MREKLQFEICRLESSINIPFSQFKQSFDVEYYSSLNLPIFFVCRRGNDSQHAVQFSKQNGFYNCFDICGGLNEWALKVDSEFPQY